MSVFDGSVPQPGEIFMECPDNCRVLSSYGQDVEIANYSLPRLDDRIVFSGNPPGERVSQCPTSEPGPESFS